MSDNPYSDILHLPHHISEKHPSMSMRERAAQFSPFAALSGYGDAILEAGRCTEKEPEHSVCEAEYLNGQLSLLVLHTIERPVVTVTWFRPDPLKSGGSFVTEALIIRKVDVERQLLISENETEIPFRALTRLEFSLPEYSG